MGTTRPFPEILCLPQEKTFKVSKSSTEARDFPSLSDAASIDLSVIVPAYNEQERLPKMLDECLEFLEKRSSSYEVIIVDDGSKDSTSAVGLDYVEKFGCDKVRVLTLGKNRGKGGAVRMGMLRPRGENLLFADADGATTFADLTKLEDAMKDISAEGELQGIVCGSCTSGGREHCTEDDNQNHPHDWLSCMRVGLCCENGQGYPVWFQTFEKEICGSSFQYPSHREMGF